MRLADLERDASALCSSVMRERYLQGAGLKPELELGPIYDRHPALFDLETYLEVRGMLPEDVRGEKYQRLLLDFLAGKFLQRAAREQTEAIALAEATATITWRDRELTYRTAPLVWTNEPDPDLRHEVYDQWREACAALNPRRAERHRRMHELVPELQHADYVTLWDELGGLRLEWLAGQMRELLASTADLYRDTLRDVLADHGLTLQDAWRADLAFALRGKHLDDLFPSKGLLPMLVGTLRGLGFDLEDQRRDATPRGRPRRALRQHRPGPAVRLQVGRRQLGHRGLRLPAPLPDDRRIVAAPPARDG
jgi:hypothetical protein